MLAGSLRPARGIAHAETEAAYERARVLCEGTGDVRRLGLALGGLASFYSNAGSPARGGVLAARVLTLAEQSDDRELAILGNVELAVAESWEGKHVAAVGHFDAARRTYEAERQAARASTIDGRPDVMPLSYLDLRIIALAQGAWSIGPLGYVDRALARAREAVALAHELRDPFNLAFTLAGESIVHAVRRDLPAQRARAEEAAALSEANGFPLFLGLGRVYEASARVAAGERAAVADVLEGLEILTGTGSQAGAPSMLGLLAETYMNADLLAEARGAIEMGFAIAAQTGQPSADSLLHRLQGELVLRMVNGSRPTAEVAQSAEECFRRALDVARIQETKHWELLAAMSLARLWRDQGKRTEARDLLIPLYGWFTEGLDTRDLRDAKALLDELA
jgi:tetratricopeptide (TPR) repeat protein